MATAFAAAGVTEPLDALNRLNEIARRYCESQMLFAGCGLGIFENFLKDRPRHMTLRRGWVLIRRRATAS